MAASTEDDKPRLPRTDIPPDYACPYPDCIWKLPENKRPELTFRNHMAQQHGVYYEKAPASPTAMKLAKYERYGAGLTEITQLAPWHRLALARHMAYGQPFADVAKEMRHSPETIRAVAKSPAGQAFMQQLDQELSDPVKLVKNLTKSDTFEMYMMWQQARDWAYAARDYEAIHKMAKDIGLQPIIEDSAKPGATHLTLHLSVPNLEMPEIKTSWKEVEKAQEADFELEPDD